MDKNLTINEALGVSNGRAKLLNSIMIAGMFLAFKRQDASGETEQNDGNNFCEGVELALKEVTTIPEAYVMGGHGEDLIEKLRGSDTEDFNKQIKRFYAEGDTVLTLATKLDAQVPEKELLDPMDMFERAFGKMAHN